MDPLFYEPNVQQSPHYIRSINGVATDKIKLEGKDG